MKNSTNVAALEEALKRYEEGVRLVRICNEKLEDAERRIRILKMTPDGETVEEAFSAETVTEEA